MKRRPLMERLRSRIVEDANGCWIYTGLLNDSGYGIIGSGGRGGRYLRVHRVMYEAEVGQIPDGLVIDHLCRVRACCNPQHLEPVTDGENVRRGVRKTLQDRCKQGHPFTPENTKVTPRQRTCLTCSRAASRAYQRRRRAAQRLAKIGQAA